MQSDKKTRQVSVPFTAVPFNSVFYYYPWSNHIVYAIPSGMNITELYLILDIQAPDDQSLSFKLAIGGVDEYYDYDTMTSDEIDISHRKLTGGDDKFTISAGERDVIELNLLPTLPQVGDNYYNKDCFVLVIDCDEAPDFSLSGHIIENVSGSSVLGVK